MLIFEIITLLKLGIRSFLTDPFNYFDAASLCFTIFILMNDFFEIIDLSAATLSILVALAVFVLCIKVFYWFRLFTGLSFYMRLIQETIRDMRFILIIFLTIIGMFSLVVFAYNNGKP